VDVLVQKKAEFPGLEIGDEISNENLTLIFKCSSLGGMRRSKETDSLVLVSDHTRGIVHDDHWRESVLHFTGMGLAGDQRINFMQNKTLLESDSNGVKVYLFEVFVPDKYRYQGQVKVAGKPYRTTQPDNKGHNRRVWIFPLKKIIDEKVTTEMVAAITEEDFENKLRFKERQARVLSNSELKNNLETVPKKPDVQSVVSKRYEPSAIVAEFARRNAQGKCQLCNSTAPFLNKDFVPFLEIHHIEWLSKGGTDTIDNAVALCPNCHRKMHFLDFDRDKTFLKGRAKLSNQSDF
jgi:5-methylcytosine-specific restriction enzyme A